MSLTQQQLESLLWGAAEYLRGQIDASDYKQYIFPLLFFKRLSDVYEDEFQEALEFSDGDKDYADLPEQHRFVILKNTRWEKLRETTTDVGSFIQKAFRMIEKENERLYGVFGDAQWTNKERLPDHLLASLVEHFSKIPLGIKAVTQDDLGAAYEYLIKKFADDSGHTAAEFYTNRTVVHLMTRTMGLKPGESAYDPTCGTGGMLLNAVMDLRTKGEEWRTVKLSGQEVNLLTSAIARMNMFLHDIEEFDIQRGDTLAEPKFLEQDRLKQFDVIFANPPYSIKKWDRSRFSSDPYKRNEFGVPPQGCADYAFFQHIVKSLHPQTGRAAMLWPHGVLFRDSEAEIRKQIIEADLLSLMRNQLEAAERIGITARTINSTNTDEWDQIQDELIADNVDVLLISPERLANKKFREDVLSVIAEKIGFFVIDEAHCISDWGHDFRPDYRRIVRVLQAIPSNIPVLATTATANDRVVNDVISQLGNNIELVRGSLVRESLKLQNIKMSNPAERMAWLAMTIPNLEGSGIIYTLTQRDTERLSDWLQKNNINAKAYHSGISKGENEGSIKEKREQQLLNNEIKVLVATVALGMGFDKPDLGFVIHYQRPASVVHYYQQVGRAGRAVDEAYGILLCGEEDDHIADYFRRNAFPPQKHISTIIKVLHESDDGLSVPKIQEKFNLKKSQIEKTIRFLTVESPSPITKVGTKWYVTPAAADYEINQNYVDEITQTRINELAQMQEYMGHQGCLMEFLERALDDENPQKCGKCRNCNPDLLLNEQIDDNLANQAAIFLRRNYQPIKPRKQWPSKNMFNSYEFEKGKITDELQFSEGRALSVWRDAGWGQLVATGKYKTHHFDDQLIIACIEMITAWGPSPIPKWVACIPSLNHPDLVPDFAERLANAMGLPFIPCIEKVLDNKQQKFFENSFQQLKNLDGVFEVNSKFMDSPCLLVDDMVDSRWTFTVASALLRQAGCETVYPLALTLNTPRMD